MHVEYVVCILSSTNTSLKILFLMFDESVRDLDFTFNSTSILIINAYNALYFDGNSNLWAYQVDRDFTYYIFYCNHYYFICKLFFYFESKS